MNPRLRAILTAAAYSSGLTVEQLQSATRTRAIADARMMYAVIARSEGHTLHDIADAVNRHHSAVVHLISRHRELVETDRIYRSRFNALAQSLNTDTQQN